MVLTIEPVCPFGSWHSEFYHTGNALVARIATLAGEAHMGGQFVSWHCRCVSIYTIDCQAACKPEFHHVPPIQRNHPGRHPRDDAAVRPQPRSAGGHGHRPAPTAARCTPELAA